MRKVFYNLLTLDLDFLSDCRIDAEASSLRKKLSEITTSQGVVKKVDYKAAEETEATLEVCSVVTFFLLLFVLSVMNFCSATNIIIYVIGL